MLTDEETKFKVKLDNALIGYTHNIQQFITDFKKIRTNGKIELTTSITYSDSQISILSDSGRILRVLFTSKIRDTDFKKLALLSYSKLLSSGYIEYLDIEEQITAKIAKEYEQFFEDQTYTHVQISEILLHDIASASIPLLNYNGPARITYGQKLFKQTVTKIEKERVWPTATRLYSSYHSERPIVQTPVHALLNQLNTNINSGVNITIAVVPANSYNMDDALVIKKSSVDRGLFNGILLKTYSAETSEKLNAPLLNNFIKPTDSVKDYQGEEAYETLESDGLPAINSEIKGGQALIGRIKLLDYGGSLVLGGQQYYDNSVFLARAPGNYKVKQVMLTVTDTLSKIAKVTVSAKRELTIGDKLSSRYAQKGAVGSIEPDHKLPYSLKTGLTPDLLIGPGAYPTRYTFGHTLQILLGKAGALSYKRQCQFYGLSDIDAIKKTLKDAGFNENGTEQYVNPYTGRVIKMPIYTGISYYLRLHHLAIDKLHCRDKGPVQLLTRQATAGKKVGGGLRYGEMQRDCTLAHGAPVTCHERLSIDAQKFLVCQNCNVLVDNLHNVKTVCHLCHQSENIKYIELPYAFKLLVNEINALCIKVLLYTV